MIRSIKFAALLLILSPFSGAIPLSDNTHESRLDRRLSSCPSFQGNSDFYGLGVRIGVYLQWITTLIVDVPTWNDFFEILIADSIFCFSLLIGLTVAAHDGLINSAEAYIMMLMCFVFAITLPIIVAGRRFVYNWKVRSQEATPVEEDSTRGLFANCLYVVMSGYCLGLSLWIWWSFASSENTESCDHLIYFFGRHLLKDGTLSALRGLTTLFTVCAALELISTTLIRIAFPKLRDQMNGDSRENVSHLFMVGTQCIIFLTSASVFVSIAFIEATISTAGMQGVYDVRSTGQLIPLVGGLASFVSAFRQPFKKYLQKPLETLWERKL